MKILVIYGSIGSKSVNRSLARAAEKLAPAGMTLELQGLHDLPMFSEDLEASAFPEAATRLNAQIAAADGVLVVTPEYNRSMPGVLKNGFDWASRPDGATHWKNKPVGVLGTSNGNRGASFAQYDVKRVLAYFDAHVMGQPEFYLAQGDKKLDIDGNLSDEKAKEVLARFLEKFKAHVELFKK